jgi:hypothetical protein
MIRRRGDEDQDEKLSAAGLVALPGARDGKERLTLMAARAVQCAEAQRETGHATAGTARAKLWLLPSAALLLRPEAAAFTHARAICPVVGLAAAAHARVLHARCCWLLAAARVH